MIRAFGIVTILAALGGCVGGVDPPSLALRPSETASAIDKATPGVSSTPVTEAPGANAVFDSLTAAKLGAIVDRARQSVAPFAVALAPARAAVGAAAGAAVSSDAWIAAQLELTRLERARAPAATALADFDVAKREQITSGKRYDHAALDAMEAIVAGVNSDQQAQTAALRAKLRTK